MNWNNSESIQNQSNPMAMRARRPNNVDMSEQWIVNDALAMGLFKGTYPGLKLASAIAYTVVFVPVAFAGLPIPKAKDGDESPTQLALNELTGMISRELQKLFLTRRIIGTAWAWAKWDSKNNRVCLELIPNTSITDIIRDLESGEMTAVIITEQLTIQTGENRQAIVDRKRTITRDRIKVEYSGQVPAGLKNSETRNPAGILPIPFANDVLDGSIRGSSVYTRLISDLKNYHDVDLKWTTELTKFNVKMIKTIKTSVDEWKRANQVADLAEIDVAEWDLDFILEGEDVKFIFPEHFSDAHEKRLAVTFYKIVQGGGVPEMFFGLVTTGNHASAEEQMTMLVNTVQDDRNQIDDPIRILYAACLRLMSIARMTQFGDFTHEWNDLETVSQETKAKIFQMFGESVSKLTANASIPLQTLHKMFLASFPKATAGEFDEFLAQMNLAARFKQFQSASLAEAADVAGVTADEGQA